MHLVGHSHMTRYQYRLGTIIYELKNSLRSLENDKYVFNLRRVENDVFASHAELGRTMQVFKAEMKLDTMSAKA